MRRKGLKWAVLCVLMVITAIIFMGAGENQECKAVERLLEIRTDVLTHMLEGQISYEEGKKQLQEIEAGSLYRKDLDAIRQYEDSDYDPVLEMNILSVKQTSNIYDTYSFQGEIQWVCQDGDGRYAQRCVYQIGAEKKEGVLRLQSLEMQEND